MYYQKYTNLDLLKLAELNKDVYKQPNPFPSIYFDNFFKEDYLTEVLNEFPDLSRQKEISSFNNQNEKKFASNGDILFGEKTRELLNFCNSKYFLNFLQTITGINEPLIGDPYFLGGGLHEIKKGGLLEVHADFNKHSLLNLDRRINVLIYLNKDWKEEYGGHFELWDKEMSGPPIQLLPIFNRICIFSTTDFSYHGHPNPLTCPENMSRKSLALYYYSNGRPQEEINTGLENHSTLFKKRTK
jgi:Rps23 Pro-64 3,4-dihydroxylase Tpa1-like proline 4-hydroxylase